MSEIAIFVPLDDGGTAGDAVSRRVPMPRNLRHRLEGVEIVAYATVTGHPSNFATVSVKDAAGNALGSRDTDSGSGGTLTGGTVESLSLSGDLDVSAGGFLDVLLAKDGTGVAASVGVILTMRRGRAV